MISRTYKFNVAKDELNSYVDKTYIWIRRIFQVIDILSLRENT
jgi:hypothetical protein